MATYKTIERSLSNYKLDKKILRQIQKLTVGSPNNKEIDRRMEEINKLLGGYGVEAIRGEWQNGYWCDIRALYVNMGDTYRGTVIYDRDREKFYVMDYGTWIEFCERNGEKFE